jgi:nicotinamide riboside kinase
LHAVTKSKNEIFIIKIQTVIFKNKFSELKKISITGPESSGKTALAKDLCGHFSFEYVAEYSRDLLQGGGKIVSARDLVNIARQQIESELKASKSSAIIICDTDLLVLKIWNEEKFGPLHPALNALYMHHKYDYTLLCTPDLNWEPDPLRENPFDRDRLFEIYKKNLIRSKVKFDIVVGKGLSRMNAAKDLISTYLQKN